MITLEQLEDIQTHIKHDDDCPEVGFEVEECPCGACQSYRVVDDQIKGMQSQMAICL